MITIFMANGMQYELRIASVSNHDLFLILLEQEFVKVNPKIQYKANKINQHDYSIIVDCEASQKPLLRELILKVGQLSKVQ